MTLQNSKPLCAYLSLDKLTVEFDCRYWVRGMQPIWVTFVYPEPPDKLLAMPDFSFKKELSRRHSSLKGKRHWKECRLTLSLRGTLWISTMDFCTLRYQLDQRDIPLYNKGVLQMSEQGEHLQSQKLLWKMFPDNECFTLK